MNNGLVLVLLLLIVIPACVLVQFKMEFTRSFISRDDMKSAFSHIRESLLQLPGSDDS